jgi:protein-S-isoprenylcysteine O-methyltransferase Ste14
MSSGKLAANVIIRSAFWIILMALLLFLPAGTWNWAQGWAFLGLFIIASTAFGIWMYRRDPALLAERAGPLIQSGQPLWDKAFLVVFIGLWCVWLALMALDAHRWRLSSVPIWVNAVGAVLFVAGFAATARVLRENTFAAPVIRVQSERSQHVIDTGPYAIVRHPMYAAAILYLLGMPLLLGSWYGLIGALAIMLGMAWRSVREERALARDLAGYADYMSRVRYRLIPGVW